MAKPMKISFETDSLFILRAGRSQRGWCARCSAEVEMIALGKAGMISNIERSELEEWLNSEELHRSQAEDGTAMICLNSLMARVQNTNSR